MSNEEDVALRHLESLGFVELMGVHKWLFALAKVNNDSYLTKLSFIVYGMAVAEDIRLNEAHVAQREQGESK